MSGWRLEKKSQTAYRFKKKEGRALVALLSFLCNRNEVSYYIKKRHTKLSPYALVSVFTIPGSA